MMVDAYRFFAISQLFILGDMGDFRKEVPNITACTITLYSDERTPVY